MTALDETRAGAPPARIRRTLFFVISCLISTVVVWLMLRRGTLPRERAFMLGIFLLAALLWVTEALPLFATALLVIALQIVLLANPAGWNGLGFQQGKSPGLQQILGATADPVLVLFFGGFLLAQAAVKEGVDSAMASLILRPFGSRPATALLGVMLVTALFSMWMSNTATATMMMALVIPMLGAIPRDNEFRKAMVLAVPFAANIGGMGTPIGTPPNAVAIGFLRSAGFPLPFFQWMLLAVPVMCVLLLLTWLLLLRLYPPGARRLHLTVRPRPLTLRSAYVVLTFTLTVLLWLSERWHRLPASVVALLPAIAFTAPGLLTHRDVNSLDWNILILIAGGISLGAGVQMTGLDETLVSLLPRDSGQSILPMLALLSMVTVLLSTFMSNTAAANLLLPIGISFAMTLSRSEAELPIRFAASIALSASVAMALPISTPPNAIAYARGEVTTREMAIPGAVLGIVGTVLVVASTGAIIRLWGFR